MGMIAGILESLAVAEFSSWHFFRREIFVKTDHPNSRPNALTLKHYWI